MYFLDESLEFYHPKSAEELKEARSWLFGHLQSIVLYSDFIQIYLEYEARLMNCLDNYHAVMVGVKQADMTDGAVRFDCLCDLRGVHARLESARTDLRELAKLFAINHFEKRAGFELSKDEYDFTVDS